MVLILHLMGQRTYQRREIPKMTRSSRTRRAKARARKNADKNSAVQTTGVAKSDSVEASRLPVMSKTDKRYLFAFAVLSIIITAIYWWMGGRNLLVFPAILCVSVGVRKYWAGPVRRFADNS